MAGSQALKNARRAAILSRERQARNHRDAREIANMACTPYRAMDIPSDIMEMRARIEREGAANVPDRDRNRVAGGLPLGYMTSPYEVVKPRAAA